MTQSDSVVLGIDISKTTFDVALLGPTTTKHKQFTNSPKGFGALRRWLAKQTSNSIHACMEATGTYGRALAQFLYEQSIAVSVVNPTRIKGFAQSELNRTKTDKTDAALIGWFCLALRPHLWQPEAWEIQQLKAFTRRLDGLKMMYQQERNRLEGAEGFIATDIRMHLKELRQRIQTLKKLIADHMEQHPLLRQQQALLLSIPGIGEKTCAQLLATCGAIQQFPNAKKLAAFCGLSPREYQSGSSVKRRGGLSKIGHANLRKALFFPALVGMKYNPVLKSLQKRLLDAGKPKMVIVGAAMRKLLHLIYGVLKSSTPFRLDSDAVST